MQRQRHAHHHQRGLRARFGASIISGPSSARGHRENGVMVGQPSTPIGESVCLTIDKAYYGTEDKLPDYEAVVEADQKQAVNVDDISLPAYEDVPEKEKGNVPY